MNSIFLTGFILTFTYGDSRGLMRAPKARESPPNVHVATDEIRKSMQESFDPRYGVTNIDLSRIDGLRASLDREIARADGDLAILLKATRAYVDHSQALGERLRAASRALGAGYVLHFTNSPTQEDFARRRQLVQNYQVANETVRGADKAMFFKGELRRLGMASDDIDRQIEILEQSAERKQLHLQLRETDTRRMAATLQILDLLESHPDQWEVKSGRLSFLNARTSSTYYELLEECHSAVAENIEAQRQLIERE